MLMLAFTLLTATHAVSAAAAAAVTDAAAYGCSTDVDCSLSGTCVAGKCVCEQWTKGPDCAALNLIPLASEAELAPAVLPVANMTRWGSSPVFDNGVYHLFSAEMADHCSLSVWGYKSQVIHSTSKSPTGPFTRHDLAVGTEAHNPVLSRAIDGTWLLWTCGCPHTATPGCSKETLTCPGGKAAAWTTTVYSSQSLDGPWEPHVDVLNGIGGNNLSQNVSPLHEANGTVMLMFKGPDNNTEASIAIAEHWAGPYTLQPKHTNIFAAATLANNITNEDCWWWRSKKTGSYHVLSHRMELTDRTGPVSGGHAFANSIDDWHYAITPAYTVNVDFAGGAGKNASKLQRRERPQLLLDAEGQPSVLYNAASISLSGNDGRPFTFAQKLGPAEE